jgi:glycosyltransferase involved in cell wall biosynthesis
MAQPSVPLAPPQRPSPLTVATDQASTVDLIHVVFSIDTMSVGGTEMNALRTAARLDRSRFRVTVVTLRGEGPLAERYAAIGVPVRRFPIFSLYGPATVRQSIGLARFLREERVSVVHCHDQYSNFFSVASARLARVPVVLSSKRWLHSTLAYRVANGIGFRLSTRVLANSPAVATSLERDDRLASRRIVVLPNFVDEAAFIAPSDAEREEWRRELQLSANARIIGIVASLLPVKDHGTLLRAASILRQRWPDLRVVIVGHGPERPSLEALAETLGVTQMIRFAGLRPQVPSFHHLFDVSVLCSTSEGFPNTLVEAMAAGRPIVATDTGGVRDAVRHDENGLLVPAQNPEALADGIDALLSDPERARRMGNRGRDRARDEFSAQAVIGSLERLYEQLLAGSRTR